MVHGQLSFKNNHLHEGCSDNTMDRVLPLHVVNPGLIPNTSCGLKAINK